MAMVLVTLYMMCAVLALAAGIWGAVSDIRGLRIPDACNVVIAVTAVCAMALCYAGGVRIMGYWGPHLIAAGILFLSTFAMFWANVLGAGDSKMATAFGLWVGLKGLFVFVFYTAFIGGVLGLAAILIARTKPFKNPRAGSWIARLQAGEKKVPYGVALVSGALLAFLKLNFLNPESLARFLQNGV